MRNATKPSLQRVLRVYYLMLRLQYRDQMNQRGAFLFVVCVGGMVNVLMALAWLWLFRHGTFNGWSWFDYVGMYGVSMLVYGIVHAFSTGIKSLPQLVDSGGFDDILLEPMPPVAQLAAYRVDITAPIDAGMGLVTLVVYMAFTPVDLGRLAVFVPSMITAVLALWCFAILLPNTIAFYLRSSARVVFVASVLVLDGSSSPSGLIVGLVRLLYLVGIPALLVAAVPSRVLSHYEWKEAVIGLAVMMFWLPVALWLFGRGRRRYTGSNLIGAR